MMPFNGSGIFTRLYNWVQDATNSIDIMASRMDGEDNGFADGLSNCVTRDGQSPMQSNLSMGNNKLTNLANATLDTGALNQASGDARYLPLTGGTVAGNLAVSGNASVAGTFGVVGAVALSSTLAVTGAVAVASTLTVTGSAVFNNNATVATQLNVGGNALFQHDGTNGYLRSQVGKLYLGSAGSNWIEITATGNAIFGQSIYATGSIFPGNDAAFYLSMVGGQPILNWDTNDGLGFNRGTNVAYVAIGGNLVFQVDNSGARDRDGNELGYKDVPQNAQSSSYVLVLTDRGKDVYMTGGSTVTVPPNSSVAFPLESIIVVTNDSGGNLTLTQGAGVTFVWAGVGTTGNRTLANAGVATFRKVGTNRWFVGGTGLS